MGGFSAGFVLDYGVDTAGSFAKTPLRKALCGIVEQIEKRVVEVMNLKVVVGNQDCRVDVIQKQIQKLV